MAEKAGEEKAPSSSENLTCPLCLDIFDEATILTSCGHTFCRKCLKNYDLSHQDLDHMICPLCRKITKLSANRVDDFLTNVTVNGLVDNYHAKCGGMNAVLEMRLKCTACKFHQDATELEKNIQNVEVQRHEVYNAVQKLLDDVSQAYSIKAKELEENHRNLIEQINVVKRSFDHDLNVLKSNDRQKIKSIRSSLTLVANDRLGRLEKDSLSAHTLLCEELDAMLKEATDHTSVAAVAKKAQEKRFKPADDTRLELGSISGSATDHTSAAAMRRKTQTKTFKSADDTRLDLGSVLESEPKLQVIQCVDLRGAMWDMTPYSKDSVAIGYLCIPGIDIIDSAGKQEQYTNIPSNMICYGLVFQQNRSLCIATSDKQAHIFSPNGSRKSTMPMIGSGLLILNRSPSDEIVIADNEKQVYIYDPTGSTHKHIVPTKHNKTKQISATRSGLFVTSSCNTNPSVVTVYDRKGKAGKSLQASNRVYLYAAVDEQDRVYVASVDGMNGNVVIRLYDLDGLNMIERVEFNFSYDMRE
eukprot:XP_011663651.1 PREDICTED: uncharacterized protein LOC105438035 [Strongylocentrotus purpuratus]